MKKILTIICVLVLSITAAHSETFNLVSKNLKILENDCWKTYPGGEGINIIMNINDNNTTIMIHSNKFQIFNVYEVSQKHLNPSGHYQFIMKAYDEDGVRCTIRVVERKDNEGPIQLYFLYNNISYVYSCDKYY